MAWIEERTQAGTTTWRVVWRKNGEKPQQTFHDKADAEEFLDLVKSAKNNWPRGWIPGQGWADEIQAESTAPLFRDYAAQTIAARGRADYRSKGDYERMLALHINPVLGELPLDQITRFHVSQVADKMREKGRKPKTLANVHGLLSSILADAYGDEHVRRNVAVGALPVLPDSKSEDMVFLSHAEFQLVLDRLLGVDRDLARLLAGTGLRWSEATALQSGDVDLLKRKALYVRRSWKRRDNYFELGEPKTRRSRRAVSLSPALIEMLASYVDLDPAKFIFTTAYGRPIRHSNWYNRVWRPAVLRARVCDSHHALYIAAKEADPKAKLTPCGCVGTLTKSPGIHSLRHTHASWLIDEKITLPAIQRRLGHESIQTTIDRYGHLVPEHEDEINAAVDRALSGV